MEFLIVLAVIGLVLLLIFRGKKSTDITESQIPSVPLQGEKTQAKSRTLGDPQDFSISQPSASEAKVLVTEFLQPDQFMEAFNSALYKTGFIYVAELRDDANVTKLSNMLWSQTLPTPLRLALKVTMGRKKFDELIFTASDRMLVQGAIDISFLTPGRSFYLNKCSVHGLPQNKYAVCSGCRNDPEIAIVSCPKCSSGERAIHIGHVSNAEFDRTCLVCASGRS